MKKLFLFIAFIFAFTVSNAMVDNGNDKEQSSYVSVDYDVGTVSSDVFLHQDIFLVQPDQKQSNKTIYHAKTTSEADYQYIENVFDVGIGKSINVCDYNKENYLHAVEYNPPDNFNTVTYTELVCWRAPRDALVRI